MKRILALAAFAAFGCSAAPKLPPDTVVLENGKDKVTAQDFDAAMTRFPEDLRDEARAQPDTIIKMLDALYVNRVLANRARAAGADKDPLVATRMEQLVEAYLAQGYLEQFEKTVKVPPLDQRAREIYLVDPKKYGDPAMVSLSHIVVSMWGRTADMARQRALEAKALLDAGKPWAEVAAQYSDDPNVKRHRGNLGMVKQGDLEPVIGEALDKLKPGQVSEPLNSRTGVHLVRLDDRRAAAVPKYEQVKALIVEQETDRLRKKATEDVVSAIRTDPKNVIHKDRVEALKSDFDPAKLQDSRKAEIDRIRQEGFGGGR